MCPFAEAHPDAGGKDFLQSRNSDGLKVTEYLGPTLAGVQPDQKFQFERHGYFVADRTDRGVSGNVVFNRVTGLKDSLGK